MGLFERFPYTNFHELNAGWLINKMKELEQIIEQFIVEESVKYADPIFWNITTQYSKNTIVMDSTGNAYLSIKIVPPGIQLNNSEYWLEMFNYSDYVKTANQNLTINIESNTTRATAAYNIDDWLIYNNVLYKVTSPIAVDDALIISPESGYNLLHFTVEDFLKAFISYATGLINQYKYDIDASELAYKNQLALDIANTTASLQAQLDLAISGATVDSEVINARLGVDGITYPTLGDAIRTQIGYNTNNILKLITTDHFEFDKVSNEYVKGSDGTFNASPGWFRTNKIPCRGASYVYAGPFPTVNSYNAFYDKDGNYISNAILQTTSVPAARRVTVPTNAYYVAFSVEDTELNSFDIRIESYSDQVKNALTSLIGENTDFCELNQESIRNLISMIVDDGCYNPSYVDDEYVKNTDGSFAATSNWFRTGLLPCFGIETLHVGPVPTINTYNGFYDKDGNYLGRVTIQTASRPAGQIVNVPAGACYFAFSFESSVKNTLKIKADIPDIELIKKILNNNAPDLKNNNLDKEMAIKAAVSAPSYAYSVQDPTQIKNWNPMILILTDVHDDWDAFNRALDFADSCDQVLCSISLGDLTTFGNITSAEAIDLFTSHTKPVFRILGNHEVMYNTGDLDTLINLYFNSTITTHNGENIQTGKAYWYKDLTVDNSIISNKKLRILGLCQFEGANNDVNPIYSNAQLSWLCNLLDNTDSDTSVIALSHYEVSPWNKNTPYNEYFTPSAAYRQSSYNINGGSPITNIIDAWINGTTVSVTNEGVTFTHTFGNAHPDQFICWLSGHNHEDYVFQVQNYNNQIDIGFACTCSSYTQAGYGDLPRRQTDKTRDCVTLVGANWFNKSVNLIRLGSDVTLDMRDRKYITIDMP